MIEPDFLRWILKWYPEYEAHLAIVPTTHSIVGIRREVLLFLEGESFRNHFSTIGFHFGDAAKWRRYRRPGPNGTLDSTVFLLEDGVSASLE